MGVETGDWRLERRNWQGRVAVAGGKVRSNRTVNQAAGSAEHAPFAPIGRVNDGPREQNIRACNNYVREVT